MAADAGLTQPARILGERPAYTLSEAADACGVSRATIRRRLDAKAFPNAYKDAEGTWLVPIADLGAAGLTPNRSAPVAEPSQNLRRAGHRARAPYRCGGRSADPGRAGGRSAPGPGRSTADAARRPFRVSP